MTPLRFASVLIALSSLGVSASARADWQERNFEIVATGAVSVPMEPAIATGVIYPDDDCDLDVCEQQQPVSITRIVYFDGADLQMVTRIGGPGALWSAPKHIFSEGHHPSLTLDRSGHEVITFTHRLGTLTGDRIVVLRGTEPGTGNNPFPEADTYVGFVAESETDYGMPPSTVLQYHGFDSLPSAAPSRIHVVYSVDGELWHAHIGHEDFLNNGEFSRAPIGLEDYAEGEDYDPDDVAGTWPVAAPLWTENHAAEDPLNYEPMPAVAYVDHGVEFRRMYQSPVAPAGWTDRTQLSEPAIQRPTIDVVRDGLPHVAWANGCEDGPSELYFRRADERNPNDLNDWADVEHTGIETACDATLSLGKDQSPQIVYVDPYSGTIELAVRSPLGYWDFDAIGEGAEPVMDYDPLHETQTIAYVDETSGELRVVDGFWY